MTKKIAIAGVHGVGKSKICEKIKSKLYNNYFDQEKAKINKDSTYGPTEIYYGFENKFAYIPEQFRDIIKHAPSFTKQTEEITLATYTKQLYLENLYTIQKKDILLCDRSVLDTFVYYDYFNKRLLERKILLDDNVAECNVIICRKIQRFIDCAKRDCQKYSKIYLIEPSDREIENDGFRLTDKEQQLEIHQQFLEYFKYFDNVEIINQEEAHGEKFINRVTSEFVL